LFGIVLVAAPGAGALALVWVIGGYAVLFGVILLAAPGPGLLGLIWVIASYAIVFGVLMVMASFRLKKHAA